MVNSSYEKSLIGLSLIILKQSEVEYLSLLSK